MRRAINPATGEVLTFSSDSLVNTLDTNMRRIASCTITLAEYRSGKSVIQKGRLGAIDYAEDHRADPDPVQDGGWDVDLYDMTAEFLDEGLDEE